MGEIKIKVKANSSKGNIRKLGDGEFEVQVKEKPINNKANEELLKMMKKYFGKDVKIKRGFSSKRKILEVEE